jgi:hypothetical protein
MRWNLAAVPRTPNGEGRKGDSLDPGLGLEWLWCDSEFSLTRVVEVIGPHLELVGAVVVLSDTREAVTDGWRGRDIREKMVRFES